MKKKFLYYNLLILLFFQNYISAEDFNEIVKNYKYIKCEFKPIYRKSKHSGLSHPHKPAHAVGTSTNWSGYAALTSFTNPTPGSVTNVTGSWIVPNIRIAKKTKFCATWVGIDGFASGTVEQLGTETDSFNGGHRYYAWWEMFPAQSNQIVGFPVAVGDSITASVTYIGNNMFVLSIANNTRGVFTTIPTSRTTLAGTQRSSAEWIVEAPSSNAGILPLANFRTIGFFNCTAVINGITGSISNGNWVNEAITMVNNKRQARSIPSGLANNGLNFTVRRQVN